ncbi:hypothetical protein BDK51DRAFT_18371 [Blyttiomyces helicus]|uniref:Histone deacetylase interacting domain-containing protein n=1 Tax=Blyttiomyces helicus TaxID=388810 RepID=A0A4P9WKJ1_9FUNG|nr:hypothetical protein BDK51DRAFT_18371 [Blyttiomyces helicus]|eukprot:RKO92645.1 hypothetical protein BDK51DRAFT_18371 [Blyttiomyces helicus]
MNAAVDTVSQYRPLNVKDALSYLDQVKIQFSDQPEVYNRFLDIMKDFKSQSIAITSNNVDTPGVIDRVSNLFRGHPQLIMGFNTFLPPGYKIEPTNNPDNPVRVTTPSDHARFQHSSTGAPTSAPDRSGPRAPVEFNHAINYVNKIKNRFSSEPDTYKQFLEILQTYQKESKPIQDVYAQVQVLFKGAPDLLDEFKQFLPDTSAAQPTGSKKSHKRPASAIATTNGSVPSLSAPAGGPPPKKKPKTNKLEKTAAMEELEFFDKCKRAIGNKTTYNEFLKVLNLFSQEIIEAKVLVGRVEPFLSKNPELLDWFKKFVKYEDEEIIYNIPVERPEIDLKHARRSGHSYRLLPSDAARPVCSGRDDLCREVLNDDWISHPVYVSETGFVSHKKTQYEEALHKCEEERYEFDLNIEANLHTIALLEPVAKRIQSMQTADEKNRYQLSPGLGGSSMTIYQRVVKKVYDKERGAEVIDALHSNPTVAAPIVLKRLKQKDEEWKRAQREWNKVWREIDAKNYYKALDHQGINFKAADRKSVTPKALVTEIESLYREQREKRSSLLNRYQFDFAFKDPEVFRDVHRLLKLQVEVILGDNEDDRVKELLGVFIRRFFALEIFSEDDDSDDSDDDEEGEDSDSEMDVDDGSVSTSVRGGRKHRATALAPAKRVAANRKSRFDSAENGTNSNGNGGGSKTPNGDDMETDDDGAADGDIESEPVPGDSMDEDGPGGIRSAAGEDGASAAGSEVAMVPLRRRSTHVMYANSAFYSFFRLYQMLYSRLVRMKELSHEMVDNPPKADTLNVVAVELGLQRENTRDQARDRYQDLLTDTYALVGGDLENPEFEERARSMFGTSAYVIFTIDKLLQATVKQVQTILSDPKCPDLMVLCNKDREKSTTSARQEATYRLAAEALIPDESLYRLEYYVTEKILTIQLIGRDEQLSDDCSTSEEKWSHYVDSFVQLSAVRAHPYARRRGSPPLSPRHPFLKRNLPARIADDPPRNVETRSGLELKICVNTYKIFFVDNTEDYFRRRGGGGVGSLVGLPREERTRRELAGRVARRERFADWMQRCGVARTGGVDHGKDCKVTTVKGVGEEYRIYEENPRV